MIKFLILICLFASFIAVPARADDYPKPAWDSLVRTMVRLNVLDPSDNDLIDDYAIIAECPLYQSFYSDDFKWNQVRAAIREAFGKPVEGGVPYGYVTKLQLDRYDFSTNTFRLTEDSAVRNVNAILFYQADGADCDKGRVKFLPKSFRAVLQTPVTIDGLKMPPAQAKALLEQMKADGNDSRTVFVRFDLKLIFADKLRRLEREAGPPIYVQGVRTSSDTFRFDAKLDGVDFFMDQDLKRSIPVEKPQF